MSNWILLETECGGGIALDYHTDPSKYGGDYQTEVGKLVYDVKYKTNISEYERQQKALKLAEKAAMLIRRMKVYPHLEAIIPTPSSKIREFQPVYFMAQVIGNIVGIKVDLDYIKKIKKTSELKSIIDVSEKEKKLRGAFSCDKKYKDKKILLFDDVYDSGSTLREVCNTLHYQGEVQKKDIFILTLTKTASKR